ncbi:fimbrial biogenesis chaperone [Shewanella youngdeokensis]|uniref:Molecular chaperone n=1 Tax=Shewanella youngdeokensis TaxID=2999068 RepID=A0ABZ0K1E8_9GAMM|nr:molecular chaperone [Shewanella sp. DAU334]
MFKLFFKSTVAAVLCVVSLLNIAQASLLVSPTRLAFEGRERSHEIVLINTSTEVRTYRLKWVEKMAMPTGGYRELSAQEAMTYNSASEMIRFSPKQVTLKPKERQVVRLGLRRPKGLADGEYRSHLKFEALPLKRDNNDSGEMSIRLDVLLSYSLPIVVRQGEVTHHIEIASKTLAFDSHTGKTQLSVNLSRSGQYSTTGSLTAFWQDGSNAEKVVARLNNVNIYPELSQTTQVMAWIEKDFRPASGTLRIVYEGKQEFNGQIFAEREFKVTPAMFNAQL